MAAGAASQRTRAGDAQQVCPDADENAAAESAERRRLPDGQPAGGSTVCAGV